MGNQSITVINRFEVPPSSEVDFLAFFNTHIKIINSQPGNIECRLFKSGNNEDILSFISIVRWQNQEVLKNAKVKIDTISKKSGIDIKEFQEKHNIKVINGIFSEVSIL